MTGPLRRAAFGALLAALLLAGAEGVVRLLGVAAPGPPEAPGGRWYRLSETLGWAPRPGFRGEMYGAERAFGEDGLFAEDGRQAADRRAPKVLLLGDSRTFGFRTPVPETFGELLEVRSGRASPRLAAINLAVPGYSVVQGEARLLEDGLPIEPAAIVVAFGFNDRRYVLADEERDRAERFRRLAGEGRRMDLLGRLALARLIGTAVRGDGERYDREGGPVDLTRLGVRVPEDRYEAALGRLLAAAARRRVPTVVLLLPDNPAQTAGLRRGAELVAAGEPERAVPLLERVAAGGTVFDDLARLELARAWRALGEPERAARAATAPRSWRSLHGGNLLRLEGGYHAAARRAAAEADATVVDLTAELAAGDFLDYCHLSPAGHRRVAAHLAPALAEALGARDIPGSSPYIPNRSRASSSTRSSTTP